MVGLNGLVKIQPDQLKQGMKVVLVKEVVVNANGYWCMSYHGDGSLVTNIHKDTDYFVRFEIKSAADLKLGDRVMACSDALGKVVTGLVHGLFYDGEIPACRLLLDGGAYVKCMGGVWVYHRMQGAS